jgi:hypothetical protein
MLLWSETTYFIETNESNFVLGAVPLWPEKYVQLVDIYSRTITTSELKYDIHD